MARSTKLETANLTTINNTLVSHDGRLNTLEASANPTALAPLDTTATIYVDGISGDDASANPESSGTPLQTIAAAASYAKNKYLIVDGGLLVFRVNVDYSFGQQNVSFDGDDFNTGLKYIRFQSITASTRTRWSIASGIGANLVFENFDSLTIQSLNFNFNVQIKDCGKVIFLQTNLFYNAVQIKNCLSVTSNQSNQGIWMMPGAGVLDFLSIKAVDTGFYQQSDSPVTFKNINAVFVSGYVNAFSQNAVRFDSCYRVVLQDFTIAVRNLTSIGSGTEDFHATFTFKNSNIYTTDNARTITLDTGSDTIRPAIAYFENCFVSIRLNILKFFTSTINQQNGEKHLFYFRNCYSESFNVQLGAGNIAPTPVINAVDNTYHFCRLINSTVDSLSYSTAVYSTSGGEAVVRDENSFYNGINFDSSSDPTLGNSYQSAIESINNKLLGISSEVSTAIATAINGEILPVNVLSNSVTVNPPPNPQPKNRFGVSDSRANAGANSIAIDFVGAGQNFYGGANNHNIGVDRGYAEFIYIDATVGWVLTCNSPGAPAI